CFHGRGFSDSARASRAAFRSAVFSSASSSVKSSIRDTTRLARESERVSSFAIASARSALLTLEACQSRTQFQVRKRESAAGSSPRERVRPIGGHARRPFDPFGFAQGKASVLPRQQKQKRPAGIFQAGRFELN